MNKKRIMSGMRPTGKLHLGHYIGVLKNWVKLQDEYDCHFAIADLHALTTKYDKTEDLVENINNVVLDWLSVGIDPEKSKIYLQSLVPQTTELHVYLSMTTPNRWVERDPTLKDMAKILRSNQGLEQMVSYGLMGYPVLMSADIMIFNAHCVPVGIDQVAHVEITRDIARRFNNIYKTEYFIEPKPLLTETPLMKGLDGNKMGKSFNNDIKISDDEETTTKKIMQAITDRNRLKKDDPGNPKDCEVIYDYWEIFSNNENIKDVEDQCINAKRGCAVCKRALAELINEQLKPMREKRKFFESKPELLREIILNGSEMASKEAQIVLDGCKDVMHLYR